MPVKYLFRIEDERYLKNIIEEGEIIEKENYLPILPTVLINGTIGIGTGFSTSIPSYNPLDLIKWIKVWLDNDNTYDEEYDFPKLTPWYRNFKGTIEESKNGYTTSGVLTMESKGVIRLHDIHLLIP